MNTIVEYIQSEQQTFSEAPFNSVDSLVLSSFAYFNYGASDFVNQSVVGTRLRLYDLITLCDWKMLCSGSWLKDAKDAPAFLHALTTNHRYRDVSFSFFVNERSNVVEKQFAAVTFFLDDESIYLSYRGTDGSFAGWKEDFNLCYRDIIPSQCSAAAYLSGVASATTGAIRLGGHSKGGNLAEYAALIADETVYARIVGVYNHDGPSFLSDPSSRINDVQFQELLHKTVPESSAFGMILERRSDYRVVKSSAQFLFQHVPFSWLVDGDDFLYQDKLNRSARLFDDTLDAWLRSRTPVERERFIDTVYELLISTKANSWSEFHENLVSNARCMIESGSKLDDETRHFLLQTLASLVSILRHETAKTFKHARSNWLPPRHEHYESTLSSKKDILNQIILGEGTKTG